MIQNSTTVSHALTSQSAEQSSPAQPVGLGRKPWQIENQVHFARGFPCDLDRCRVWVHDMPGNLACPTSTAILMIRSRGKFRCVPVANRHYLGRPQQAPNLLWPGLHTSPDRPPAGLGLDRWASVGVWTLAAPALMLERSCKILWPRSTGEFSEEGKSSQ